MAEKGTGIFLGGTEITAIQNNKFVFANPFSEAVAPSYQIRTDTYGSFVEIAMPGTDFGIFGQSDYSSDISSAVRGTGSDYNLIPTGSGTTEFWPSGSVVDSDYDFATEGGYSTSMFAEDAGSIGAIYGGDFSNFYGVDFVIEGWVYMNERLYQGGAPFHKSILRNTNSTFSADISFVSNGSAQYRMRVIKGGTQYFSSNITSNLNQWYHYAFSFTNSGSALRAYWDGTRIMDSTATGANTDNLFYRLLGGDMGPNDGAKGSIQDYRITIGSNRGYTGATITTPNSIVEYS